MAKRAGVPGQISIDEYLAFEEASDIRHEYVEGAVYAMTGAHSRHNRIAMNAAARLWAAARGGPCRVYASDMKLRASEDRVYYPDVMTVCAPRSDDGVVVHDPCVLIEVTSPSTVRTDRYEKRDAYLALPSLRGYLIVSQRYRRVEWFQRDGDVWHPTTLIDRGVVAVPCPVVELTLDDLYEGLALPAADEGRVREPEPAYEPEWAPN